MRLSRSPQRPVDRSAQILWLLCASLFAFCTGNPAADIEGRILEVGASEVFLSHRDSTVVQNASGGSRIGAGDLIKVEAQSEVVLLLLPGSLVHLGAATQFSPQVLALRKNGFATAEPMHRAVSLELREGVASCLIEFESDPPSWLLQTPHGVLSTATPGSCRVDVNAARTRVIAAHGTFSFQAAAPGSPATPLQTGYVCDFPSNDALPFPTELDLETNALINQLRALEQKMLALENRFRFERFPWR